MRNAPIARAEKIRIEGPAHSNNGAFRLGCLLIIASDGDGWDHVSVSTMNRVPTYAEMCQVFEIFFRDDECAMELHVPKKDHISYHPYTLHLWRPQQAEIPRPPGYMVGPTAQESELAL